MSISSVTKWIVMNQKRLQYILVMKSNVKFTLVWVTFVIGSFLHDFIPLPQSYFSSRNNFLNAVFAMKAWGWTSFMLIGYWTARLLKQRITKLNTVYKHLSRFLVLTFTWYFTTTLFDFIEYFTGKCLGNNAAINKQDCRANGFLWSGFDISGHCFLLAFCILIINEELHGTLYYNESSDQNNGVQGEADKNSRIIFSVYDVDIKEEYVDRSMEIFSICLVILMVIWEVTLFFTCAYFHTLLQKLLGMLIAVGMWYVCYGVIFKLNHSYTPCEPSSIRETTRNN